MQKSEWAAWAQAFFSVLAICASAAIVWWQHKLDAKAAREIRVYADMQQVMSIYMLTDGAHAGLRTAQTLVYGGTGLSTEQAVELNNMVASLSQFDVHAYEPSWLRPAILIAQRGAQVALENVLSLDGFLRRPEHSYDTHAAKQRLEEGLQMLTSGNERIDKWRQLLV